MSRQVTLDELSIIASNCSESIWAEAQSQGREPKLYLHWTAGGTVYGIARAAQAKYKTDSELNSESNKNPYDKGGTK